MKKYLYLIICMVGFSLQISAQQQDDAQTPNAPPPNLVGLKMAFITKQLSLNNDEAQKFWPVYYTYLDELKKARKTKPYDVLATEEGLLNVRKKNSGQIKKILVNDDRVNKTLTIERDFSNVVKRELLKRAQKRNGMMGGEKPKKGKS